jgi:hypothetical protein
MTQVRDLEFWRIVQAGYDSGMTYEQCREKFKVSFSAIAKAKKQGLLKTRTISEGIHLHLKNESLESKKSKIIKIKEGIRSSNKVFGGYRKGAGRGKKFKVFDSFGQPVTLQSSYENRLMEILTQNCIKWIRPNYFSYLLKNRKKKYFPDFYLTDYRIYIDTKNNYLIKLDKEKILAVENQNQVRIHVLAEEQISLDFLNQIINGSIR